MRILSQLLFVYLFIFIHIQPVFGQQCPTVSLPEQKNYCGSRQIAFSTLDANHTPAYTGTISSYTWYLNNTIVANTQYPTITIPVGNNVITVRVSSNNGCGTASATQTIIVESPPSAPAVENSGMCTGSMGTLSVIDPDQNLIYRWYNVATGGSPLAFGASYATATPGTYYIEAATPLGCGSSPRTRATLTASSPTGNAQSIIIGSSTSKEICSGTSPGTITGNAPQNMTFQWYQSTTGSNSDFFPIASARDKDYTPPALSQTTWYKRIAYTGFCGEESNAVKINVTPIPEAPVINDAIICLGSQATLAVTNSSNAVVYRWYDVASGGTAVGTSPTFTTPLNLPAGIKYYYVDASTPTNSSCATITVRTRVQVTVLDAIGNNAITADQSLCIGGTPAVLTGSVPTGGGGGYVYQWQRSENGSVFTDITGANGKDFAPGALTATTWYRRKVRTANSCPEVTSNTVQITVAPLAAAIDIVDEAACVGSGTTIIIANPNAAYTYRWYDAATGGTFLATGSSFSTGPLNATKTFYVEATTAAGCYTTRRPVEVKVTPVPAMPAAINVAVCAGSSATLALNSTDATLFYRWYNSAGTFLATGTSYATAPLSANATFYVEAVTNAAPGCVSPRKTVEVTVTPLITNNNISASQELCSGDIPRALSGSIPSGGGGSYTYQWQYSEDGTFFQNITGATGINYAPGALTTTTWYRRRVSAAGPCAPVVSNLIKMDVHQLPAAPLVPNKTICTGFQATLQITSPDAGINYKWYTVATGGMPIATNVSSYTSETLTSDKTYYVEAVTTLGCTSATRQPVTVTVAPLPVTPTADDVTICANSRASLSVVSPDADRQYQWYDAAQGGNLLATGTSFSTAILTSSTTYYVQAVNATGCASISRRAVAITVIPLPDIPEVTGATICSGSNTTLYINNPDPSLLYRWYSGSNLLTTGTSFLTGNLTSSATYYVEAVTNNANACAGSGRRTVVVNVIPPISNNIITANQTICSGSIPATLTGTTPAGGSGTLTYQWEKSENGVNFTAISGAASPTFSPGALTITTWYRRRVKGTDSCPENTSNAVQITVNALPATPVADGKTICTGSQATLTVNAPAAGVTYKWYNAATGGSILSSEPTLLTNELSTTTTFFVEATNAAGCVSPRRPVTVTVRELPETPLAANQSICAGQNTTLSVTSPNPSLAYKWYDANGQLLSSALSLEVTGLQASATYYLEAINTSEPACASTRREVTVLVTPLPSVPNVNNITICSGTKGVLRVQGTDPSLTYNWYIAESGGSPIHTGSTFETPTTLTSARTYYIEAVTTSGCGSGRKAATVNVSQLPATPLANNVEICAGETALLAISDADGTLTYQWYASNTAAVPLGTGTTYRTSVLQAGTTFYVEAMTASGCVSAARQAVQITVTERPAVPAAEDKTTCAGGSAILAVQNPSSSLLYKWYNDEGNHVATGIFYNTGILNENKVYYLEAVTNNSTACTSPSRRTVTVTVTPAITNNTISASQTICSGGIPARINGSVPNGGGTNYAYQWEQSMDGINFTNITGATSQDYTPNAIAATAWFRRRVSATGPCTPSVSAPVQISTVSPPTVPSADNQTICAGTAATLTIRDANAGYTYYWYSTGTGGNVLDINQSFQTPELAATTTFYVEAVNSSGCVSPRRAVTVNVTATPDIPQAADHYICEGQTATLAVSGAIQNLVYRWYDNSGTLVGTGTSYTTPDPVLTSTVYYVEAATITTPTCVSGRKAVAVSVSAVPAMPVVENKDICSGSTAQLAVRVIDPAIRYKWYTVASGGTPIAEAPAFTTSVLTSNRNYYVEAVTAAGCTSARASVTVNVTPLPAVPVADNLEVCAGANAVLAVNSFNENLTYKWYDAATEGNLLATGNTYTINAISTSTTFYVEAETTTGCVSPTRKAVKVNVTALPLAPQVNNSTVCAGQNVILSVIAPVPGELYKWYNASGSLIYTGPTYTSNTLQASTVYYVEAVTSNSTACASSSRRTVNVTVTPAIANNIITGEQTICSGSSAALLDGSAPTGGEGSYTYQWERSTDGINFSNVSGATERQFSPGMLTTDTWYRRKVNTTGTCPSSFSNIVKVTINGLPVTPVADNATICQGGTATLRIKDTNAAYIYYWYNTATGGNILRTGTTYTTNELQVNGIYYVEAVAGSGCISSRRAVTVSVLPVPEEPVAADKTVCFGGQAVLNVTTPNQSLVYKWYNSNGDQVATGATYTTAALSNNVIYYLEAASNTNPVCVSNRTAVSVSVTPLPATPLVENTTVCSGSSAVLVVQVVNPALTYKWYTTATGGTAVATGTSFNTGTLTSGRTYYAEAVTASGCASQRARIDINVTALPAPPVTSNINICAGQTATLSVDNPSANLAYRWYDAATDGNLLATGDTYITNVLSASRTFFVEAVTDNGCASTTRKAVNVNVTQLPAVPEADKVTICAGSSTTLWVRNQEPNLIYNWYSGENLVGTGLSFTTGSLNVSTTYYLEAVTNTGTACTSSTRSAVVVTVIPNISNNFISTNQSICSGSIPAQLTGSLPNGGGGNYSYQWERSEDGINFTAIANATNQDYTSTTLNITTWLRRRVKAVGPCAESVSNTIQITITPIPATPAADNIIICENATATLSIKDVNAAYTYRWYNNPVGGSAVQSGVSFTTGTLESTTTFYVEAVNAAGCISARRTVTVTVMPLPEAPLATDQNICAGSQATLAVANPAANLIYRWYSGNEDLLATGTTFTTEILNNNTTYYVEAATSTAPSCVSSRTSVAVNVAVRPATPLADDVNICAGSRAELSVKGIIPGLTYKWYTVAAGELPVHVGSTYSTAALTSSRTYYLEAVTATGCSSISRKAVTANVILQPATPVASGKTICSGQAATLVISSPEASLIYRWYDQSGAALATGNTYQTRELSASTTFYVEAVTLTSPGCTSTRKAVVVNVTQLPAIPEVADVIICAGSTATLWISNTSPSVAYKWYNENDELLGTGSSFTTPVHSASTNYFVEAVTANGCAGVSRKTVTVNIMQPISGNMISAAQNICYGGIPAMLTGSQPIGGGGNYSYQWESSEDGINFVSIATATGKDYSPAKLTATTWFRRKATAGSTCPAHSSEAVKITVEPLPAIPLVEDVTICAGANAILNIASLTADLTYRWYTVAAGGSSIATGRSFTITSVASTTTYFVEAVNGSGCSSARRAVTVFVTPLPAPPQAADKIICDGEFTTLSVTSPDPRLTYNWYNGNGILQKTGSTFTTPVLDRTTVYYVEAITATDQACKSARQAVTVSVTQKPASPVVNKVTICSGGAANLNVTNYDAALLYKWYSAASGGTALANGPIYNTTNLTSGRIYYVEASTANGCTSERKAVTVEVMALPALPMISNKTICSGQSTTLAVMDADANLSYRWYDALTGGSLLANGSTYTTGSLNASTTYYVEAVTANGCVSNSRKPVVVTVSPLPNAPAVENANICSGDKVTLFVKNPDPALEYRWYADAAATDLIGSGISYTSSTALFAGKSFFVEAVNTAGCTSSARRQVDVLVIARPDAPEVEGVAICAGSRASLSVSAPDGSLVYKWHDANGTLLHTGTTYTSVPLSSQILFYVTAFTTTQPACTSVSRVVTVRITSVLTGNRINDEQTICSGAAPATLVGSLPSGGGGTLTYQWERSEDGINFVSIVGAYAQDYAPDNLTTDTWFRRKVKASGPCSESVSNVIRITVIPQPSVPMADNITICAGSSATLRVKNPSSGTNNITYRWYNMASGGTILGSGISFNTPALTASTTYYLEAISGNGCSSSRQAVLVAVNQLITNNNVYSSQTICIGNKPGALIGSIPDGGNGAYNYQWQRSTDGTTYTDIAGATGQNYSPAETPIQNTWYRRKVTTSGPCEEHISNIVKIEVVPPPLAPTVTSTAICPGNSAILEATAMAGLTVEWYDAPQGGNLLFTGAAYKTPILATTTSFWAQTLNSSNCASAVRQEAKVLVVAPQVTVSEDITVVEDKPVQLAATGGATYNWSPATGLSDPQVANPVARPVETTTYTVTIQTKEGCSVTKQITITVLPRIIAANVLTPNGDGFNDNFEIKNIENYPDCQVEIFTRWGEKVFESKGYKQPWNGTKNGNALPMAAYYYIIRLNQNDKPISGSVTIVK